MGVAFMALALLAASYALVMIRLYWKRREYARAIRTGKLLLAGAAAYFTVLLSVSAANPHKIAAPGEDVQLCDAFGDCHLSAYVLQVERIKTLGNPPREMIANGIYYCVTVKVTSYSANPRLNPGELSAEIVDDNGRRYQRLPEGERALAARLDKENPFQLQSGPTGGSFKRLFVFEVPVTAPNPTLVVKAGGWLDRFLQLFVIGDEDSLFHGKTRLRLDIPGPAM